MPKKGLQLNYSAVGKFLKTDEHHKTVAEEVLQQMDEPEAFIERYVTDRIVFGVVVPADKQAKYGTATRAANQVASGR